MPEHPLYDYHGRAGLNRQPQGGNSVPGTAPEDSVDSVESVEIAGWTGPPVATASPAVETGVETAAEPNPARNGHGAALSGVGFVEFDPLYRDALRPSVAPSTVAAGDQHGGSAASELDEIDLAGHCPGCYCDLPDGAEPGDLCPDCDADVDAVRAESAGGGPQE